MADPLKIGPKTRTCPILIEQKAANPKLPQPLGFSPIKPIGCMPQSNRLIAS
jgi:hypothetical protein